MARKKADTRSTPKTGKSPAAKKAAGRALITSKSDLPAGDRGPSRVDPTVLGHWPDDHPAAGPGGLGKIVVERLADDIQRAFPGLSGFSRSNVFRMRAFYEAYALTVTNAAEAVPSSAGKKVAHPDDQPTIGLLLCKTRDRVIAEYALRDIIKPIGVAQWQTKLVQSLPEPLRSNLPTIEHIEEELGDPK